MTASLTWLADALRAEGCRVVEEGDWKHHQRSGPFEPYGVLWHHTGSTASYSNPFPTKNVLITGRPDLEGPLCQVGIGYDGVCHVISAGRANHAGACNGFGPFSSNKDGNEQFVGFEIDYDGTQSMSPEQKDAATRCSAAVLKRFGRNEQYAARHAETSTTGKWDTGGLTGDQIRSLIKKHMAGGSQPPPGEDDMPNYVHLQRSARTPMTEGVYQSIYWDKVIAGEEVASVGSASITIPGRLYQATLLAEIESPTIGSSTVRTRVVEGDASGPDGSFVILETNWNTEHLLTTGNTSIQDSRSGSCNKSGSTSQRRLRFQIYLPYPGSALVKADLSLLYW